MTFKTHLAIGALGGLALLELAKLDSGFTFSKDEFMLSLPFILLGSVLPDIDEPRSFIGQKLPIISHFSSSIFGHRGLTHFLIIAIALFISAFYLPQFAIYLNGLAFGILCHHIGDLLTPSGIKSYFFPFSFGKLTHTFRLLPKFLAIKTGSNVELKIILPLILLGVAYLGYQNFGENLEIKEMIKIIENTLHSI